MDYEYSRSNPFAILQWLQEGGYSCVLFVNEQKKSAYVVDEDDDYGGRRVAIQAVRHMLDYNKISAWRKHVNGWIVYRPTDWVEAWFKEYPPHTDDLTLPDERRWMHRLASESVMAEVYCVMEGVGARVEDSLDPSGERDPEADLE